MKKRFEIIDLYESNPYLGISNKKNKGKNHIFIPTFSGDSHFGP